MTEAKYKTGIYWFTNDLRVMDNQSLVLAAEQCERLICVYALDPRFRQAAVPQSSVVSSIMGDKRYQFLYESLQDLDSSLKQMHQRLLMIYQPPVRAISSLCVKFAADALFCSQNAGVYENRDFEALEKRFTNIKFHQTPTHTLFDQHNLPFQIQQLPLSFSKFRHLIEKEKRLGSIETIPAPKKLPPPPLMGMDFLGKLDTFPEPDSSTPMIFSGGESAAQTHLQQYLTKKLPSNYKQVRNNLDGWDNSTKFSPWLANGSLSARQIIKTIQKYEQQIEANDSTYWIMFELLWREYFQWYAHRHQNRLFAYRGIQGNAVLTSFYGNRFHAWCRGNTPYPIVNACIKQLNATGYMSNRGRQIVASCFVNELALDWRYGAAYFEQQLIDYDVAVNWGNWQYLAGVGADPRGKRHFDLQKQTQIYDPDLAFCTKWNAQGSASNLETVSGLDAMDAADWPVL